MLTVDRSQAKQYGDGSRRFYSVSQVLEVVTGETYWWCGDEPKEFGSQAHRMAATYYASLMGLCDLPEKPTDILMLNVYQAMLAFTKEYLVKPIQVELPVQSNLGYAGTLDLLAEIFYKGVYRLAVIDFKTGVKHKAHPIQVSAYGKALGEDTVLLAPVYLNKIKGTYKADIRQRIKPNHWGAFISALNILKMRESF